MAKKVTLLVGTKKGLYILRGDSGRGSWACEGPEFAPAEIHHAAYDPRDGSMFAAVNQTWGGSRVEVSRDMGKTWKTTKNPAFREGGDRTFSKTWHIEPGHSKTPNVVWAGTEPAALFKSEDRGETWTIVKSLDDQPSRAKWVPGFGGMGLHSIAIDATDPKKMQVGISVGGVYTSTDGGASWVQDNAQTGGKEDRPDVFYCIHKLLAHPAVSGVRFMRVHVDVFWREPGETAWRNRTEGLPSTFGFAAAMHPRDRSIAYVIPLDDTKRTASPPGIGVYSTNDRGATWTRNDNGLPAGAAHKAPRLVMDTGPLGTPGGHFGTANGDAWASPDQGKSWERAAPYLPYGTSVHAATIDQ